MLTRGHLIGQIIDDLAGIASAAEHAALASVTGKKGLSIPEAKKGLSIFFGIPAESVQLTISG